jgi:two-component system response regulator
MARDWLVVVNVLSIGTHPKRFTFPYSSLNCYVFPGDFSTRSLVQIVSVSNSPILHVEDEDASAFLLQAALEQAAIPNRTFRVSNGENALAYLYRVGAYKEAQSPRLVFLDITLPGVDGWAVLSTVKRRRDLQSIPVVILSASGLDSDRKRAASLGADSYLVKQGDVAAMGKELRDTCAELMSFRVRLEVARTYKLRVASIAFERRIDNGLEVIVARVLPEATHFKLVGVDAATSVAHILWQGRDLWMSLRDIRDHAILLTTTPPDSQAAPSPSPAS